jgi:hypothetical protein
MRQRGIPSPYRVLAPCAFVLILACQDGNEGMTTGGESGPPARVEGCFPEWEAADGDSGAEDPEGAASVCSGSGNGWIRTVVYITGPQPGKNAITRYKCMNPPIGVEPEDVTESHCIDQAIGLDELDVLTGGEVANPQVCCGETTEPEAVADACLTDCAYAACKLAVFKLRAASGEPSIGPASEDLLGFAEFLGTPQNQDRCAGKVVSAAPGVMTWSLGEGPSDDQLGHVENLTLNLQCDVTTASEQLDSCDASANTPWP